jgi:hypothetical protein
MNQMRLDALDEYRGEGEELTTLQQAMDAILASQVERHGWTSEAVLIRSALDRMQHHLSHIPAAGSDAPDRERYHIHAALQRGVEALCLLQTHLSTYSTRPQAVRRSRHLFRCTASPPPSKRGDRS